MNREFRIKELRAEAFKHNNGRVLATINLLRDKYTRLTIVESALVSEGVERAEFIDCINFLQEEGYIRLRGVEHKEEVLLCDNDYAELEAKVTGKGIRLLGGGIVDNMVYLG